MRIGRLEIRWRKKPVAKPAGWVRDELHPPVITLYGLAETILSPEGFEDWAKTVEQARRAIGEANRANPTA